MLKRNSIIAIVFFLSIACSQDKKEFHYKSQDEITGGFSDFKLDLESTGKLKLSIKLANNESNNEAGGLISFKERIISGNWSYNDNKINYSLFQTQSFIDSIANEMGINKKIKLLTFSKKLDTAFIYEIPCIKIIQSKN
ncbi:MAG: hypothetical protein WCO13_14970 [Bacteroidota bacterium]